MQQSSSHQNELLKAMFCASLVQNQIIEVTRQLLYLLDSCAVQAMALDFFCVAPSNPL